MWWDVLSELPNGLLDVIWNWTNDCSEYATVYGLLELFCTSICKNFRKMYGRHLFFSKMWYVKLLLSVQIQCHCIDWKKGSFIWSFAVASSEQNYTDLHCLMGNNDLKAWFLSSMLVWLFTCIKLQFNLEEVNLKNILKENARIFLTWAIYFPSLWVQMYTMDKNKWNRFSIELARYIRQP